MARRGIVSLSKGDFVSLTKDLQLGDKIRVGIGWTASGTLPEDIDIDLDVSAFMLSEGICEPKNFVFYKHLRDAKGALKHSPDNTTGEVNASIDAEYIDIDFTKMPEEIDSIVIVATIYQPGNKKLRFDMIDAAEVRVYNGQGADKQIATKFNLAEEYSAFTALRAVEFYRNDDDEWFLKVVSEASNNDLLDFCEEYGISAKYK